MPDPKFKITVSFQEGDTVKKLEQENFDSPYDAFLFAEDTAKIEDTLEIHITRQT